MKPDLTSVGFLRIASVLAIVLAARYRAPASQKAYFSPSRPSCFSFKVFISLSFAFLRACIASLLQFL
ncbi:unnamed protein product [Haemonchus placei]|uniref:Uncharacterized protein n=1 Tax=Haemonchus placei TaxID=6290 RepID=A0A3P7TQY1_HAEPC|nr:unnamed protein product [Haemonchus placei]